MEKETASQRIIELARNSTKRVSVVVPAYNEEQNIVPCLVALEQQIIKPFEVIVVNNRSTDRTAQLVEEFALLHPEFSLTLLHQSEYQGLIPTRNLGFDSVSGDIIGRIDADSRVLPDWVAAVTVALEHGELSAVTGPVSYYDMPFEKFWSSFDHYARRMFLFLGKEYHFLFGSNMALTKDAWIGIREVASRDEADLLHEDIDLAITLQRNEYKVGYARQMRAAISSRRIDTPKADFYHYVGRFGRTYSAHGVKKWQLKAPPTALRVGYWPLRTIHRTNRVVTNYRKRRQLRKDI